MPFSATTGRPRRIGWLDLEAVKFTTTVNGVTKVAITKLDILNGLPEIKVCVGYEGKEKLWSPNDFKDAIPIYETIKGWDDARDMKQIIPFLSFIEEKVGVDVAYVSVGVEKDDLIEIKRSYFTMKEAV